MSAPQSPVRRKGVHCYKDLQRSSAGFCGGRRRCRRAACRRGRRGGRRPPRRPVDDRRRAIASGTRGDRGGGGRHRPRRRYHHPYRRRLPAHRRHGCGGHGGADRLGAPTGGRRPPLHRRPRPPTCLRGATGGPCVPQSTPPLTRTAGPTRRRPSQTSPNARCASSSCPCGRRRVCSWCLSRAPVPRRAAAGGPTRGG